MTGPGGNGCEGGANRWRTRIARLLLLAGISLVACSVEVTGNKAGSRIADDDRGNGDDESDRDGDASSHGDGDDPSSGDGDGDAFTPKSCGASPHGATETRTRYPEALVDDHRECLAESQSRTCLNGTWSAWSGTATAGACAVTALGVCRAGIPCAEGQCTPSTSNPLVSLCLRRNGAACSDNSECVNRCVNGTCAEPSPAGGACDEKSDCSALSCLGGVLGGGATCKDARCVCPNKSPCSSNAQCEHTCLTFQCSDRNVGCDPFDQADCADDATCSAGACVRNDGAQCTKNSECKNFCIVDTCGPRSDFNQPCDEDSDCLEPLACSPGPSDRRCLRVAGATCSAASDCVSANCVCMDQACACAE